MKTILLACALVASGRAEVPDCYVRMTVAEYTNLTCRVDAMWTAYTNRQSRIAQMRSRREANKSAVQQVKDNAAKRKRRSAIGGEGAK